MFAHSIVLKVLGKGTCGTTYTDIYAGKKSAVKELFHHQPNQLPDIQDLLNIHHKNLVKYLKYCVKDELHCFYMEFCDKGNLPMYIRSHHCLSDKARIMKESACGVDALHSLDPPIIHRNIKPENILIKVEHGRDVIKISDFGLTSLLEDHPASSEGIHQSSQSNEGLYLPPEIQEPSCNLNDPSFDIFSLGLVFCAILQYNGSNTLIPHAISLQEHEDGLQVLNQMPIGIQMYEAKQKNKSMPKLFDDYDKLYIPGLQNEQEINLTKVDNGENDLYPIIYDYSKLDPGIVELQEIVKAMTTYEPDKRPMLDCLHWPLNNVYNKLEWLTSEKGNAKAKLDQLFDTFVEDMGKNIPKTIQSCSKCHDLYRININIESGNRKQVEKLVSERCRKEILSKGVVHIEEQISTRVDLAKIDIDVAWQNGILNKVQPGSTLLVLHPQIIGDLERWRAGLNAQVSEGEVKSKILELSKFYESRAPCKDSVATLGCFLIDDKDQIYGLTVAHAFDPEITGRNYQKEIISLCSEHQRECKMIKLGTEKESLFESGELDIALIPISFPNDNFKMYFECEGEEAIIEVCRESNDDIKHKVVCKRGTTTGKTKGLIVETNVRSNENGQLMGNAFRTCSLENNEIGFAVSGDSGSIVTDQLKIRSKKEAIGIVTEVLQGKTKINGNEFKDLVTCLRLDDNISAMEGKKQVKLQMFRSGAAQQTQGDNWRTRYLIYGLGTLAVALLVVKWWR